jgi:hypothetical protein
MSESDYWPKFATRKYADAAMPVTNARLSRAEQFLLDIPEGAVHI